jgi:aspartate-semialdehyde dehydrogenase
MRLRKAGKLPKIALIGADTLLGREIQEVLEKYEGASVAPYAASGEAGFGAQEGEAAYRGPFDEPALKAAEVVVLAGTEEGAERVYRLALGCGGARQVIDATGFLDARPEARIASAFESPLRHTESWLVVVAHPAATLLALLMTRLAAIAPIERAVIEVFEPASQLGKRGISELQQQTTALLAFRPLEKAVFDAQLSFSLLAAYGEEAPTPLANAEHRILSHLATLLHRTAQAAPTPMPSVRLVQAPVFHGYSLSCWIEFASRPEIATITAALASEEIEVRGAELEPPSNVGVVGQTGVQVGDLRVDPNSARSIWLWAVADNLRLSAGTVERLLLERQEVSRQRASHP